jgi:hypothetical protein
MKVDSPASLHEFDTFRGSRNGVPVSAGINNFEYLLFKVYIDLEPLFPQDTVLKIRFAGWKNLSV